MSGEDVAAPGSVPLRRVIKRRARTEPPHSKPKRRKHSPPPEEDISSCSANSSPSSTSVTSTSTSPNLRVSLNLWGLMYEDLHKNHIDEQDIKVLNSYTPFSKETYGEVASDFVHILITQLDIRPHHKFLDIGSGIGNVCFSVTAMAGCKCTGIEIRKELHDIGLRMNSHFEQMMRAHNFPINPVTLINADATITALPHDKSDAVDYSRVLSYHEFDFIFMNNWIFPAEMELKLLRKFEATLTHGTVVVTTKELGSKFNPKIARYKNSPMNIFDFPCQKHVAPENSVSWISRPIDYHIYTVNRMKK